MKSIRNMIQGNKGFTAFLLLFVFLNAGFIKGITGSVSTKSQKTETGRHASASKFDLVSADEDDSDSGFFDQLKKDIDSDDSDFILFANFTSKPYTQFQRKHQFADANLRPEMYRESLYDLYCNWKFHIA